MVAFKPRNLDSRTIQQGTPMKPLLVLAALFLSSHLAYGQSSPASSIVTKACGPDEIAFDVQTESSSQPALQPQPGKALVFVISQVWRPLRVGMDGSWVGADAAHSYLSFSVDPGEHHFCAEGKLFSASKGKQISLNSFVVESGKTYFLRARMVPTWRVDTKARDLFDLELINPDQGQFFLETLPHSVSHPRK
jgi:hypothetical protein